MKVYQFFVMWCIGAILSAALTVGMVALCIWAVIAVLQHTGIL